MYNEQPKCAFGAWAFGHRKRYHPVQTHSSIASIDSQPEAQHERPSEYDSRSTNHTCCAPNSSCALEFRQSHHRYKKTNSKSEARQLNGDVLVKDSSLSPKHYYEETSALDRSDQINGNMGDRDAFNKFFYSRIGEMDRKVKD